MTDPQQKTKFIWFVGLWLGAGLILLCALGTLAEARSLSPECRALFLPLTAAELFWSQGGAIELAKTDQGASRYLTFSFDSEIEVDEMWRAIENSTPARVSAAQADIKLRYTPISRVELGQVLKMSEKQLAIFALKKDVDKNLPKYQFYELTPMAMRAFFKKMTLQFEPMLTQYLVPLMLSLGVEVQAHMDGTHPEMTHPSSDFMPKKYFTQIQRLHQVFPSAQTHFHIGLPSELVSVRQATEIARAIEAKIILNFLKNARAYSGQRLSFVSSTFEDANVMNGVRGVVKISFNEFKSPFPAHDLEIRQWENVADGLASLQLAAELAKKGQDLSLHSTHVHGFLDPRFGNVTDALDYVSEVLIASGDSTLGIQVKTLSQEAHQDIGKTPGQKKLSDEYLAKVQKFINQNLVTQRYQDALLH